MKLFIADAFSDRHFGGNPAGVALLSPSEPFPDELFMKQLAAELKHSETAFIRPLDNQVFELRYFTPADEVDLCGHATIASFKILADEGFVKEPHCTAITKAGKLDIFTEDDSILMTMAEPANIRDFKPAENSLEDLEALKELYTAFGLTEDCRPSDLYPEIISTGLADIILPVKDSDTLNHMTPDFPLITEISKRYNVVGFHVFTLDHGHPDITAECRNFAPLYDIDEEAATGTSNGSLSCYLYQHGYIHEGQINTFLQGEAMGRPSKIMSRVSGGHIYIGGNAVILFRGNLEN